MRRKENSNSEASACLYFAVEVKGWERTSRGRNRSAPCRGLAPREEVGFYLHIAKNKNKKQVSYSNITSPYLSVAEEAGGYPAPAPLALLTLA